MRSSYLKEDVTLLLKDISGLVEPLDTKEREIRIQSGVHYCEMLPLEYKPTRKYIEIYEKMLPIFSGSTAEAVSTVSQKIWKKTAENTVLVSLARAGTPVGILIKRYIRKKYGANVPHYSISIIRGRGIDKNAMTYILARHLAGHIIFVDGWIGKGAILKELRKELGQYPEIDPEIAVLADPAYVTEMCGTHDDILIPSSCLNSTVSGLISRTFLRSDIIGPNDFHGAAYYENLAGEDRTYDFIRSVESKFLYDDTSGHEKDEPPSINGFDEVTKLAKNYKIENINFVKPGIGETTRVLLRRVPWKVLVNKTYADSVELRHIFQLAGEKNVPVEYIAMTHYKCCGLIKNMADA
ncbi:MAG: cysteine protease StiP family protein [Lachnospiraceae bacterium]|nr:cysteine protease StiP family protein [Lachnospiraceae bacterium]